LTGMIIHSAWAYDVLQGVEPLACLALRVNPATAERSRTPRSRYSLLMKKQRTNRVAQLCTTKGLLAHMIFMSTCGCLQVHKELVAPACPSKLPCSAQLVLANAATFKSERKPVIPCSV
jgi:hypothetical protein